MAPSGREMLSDLSHRPHNENQGRVILFLALFSALSLVAVALRILSKWMQQSKLFWDDILLVAAIVQMLAANILFAVGKCYLLFTSWTIELIRYSHTTGRIRPSHLGRHSGAVSLFQQELFCCWARDAFVLRNC